mgnify:CR=1 FL=1
MPKRSLSGRRGLTRERLLALFVFGALLFTPPWLGVFSKPVLVLGIPLLYVYLFVAWALIIALAASICETAPIDGELSAAPVTHERMDDGAQADALVHAARGEAAP